MADVPNLFLPYLQSGRGVSLEGSRLKADDKHFIRPARIKVGTSGGTVNLAATIDHAAVKARDKREAIDRRRAEKRSSRHRNRSNA